MQHFLGQPNPIALTIGNFEIRWYAVLICLALLLGMVICYFRMKKDGLNPDWIYDLVLYTVPLAIIGARLYYVAFSWEYYAGNLIKIFAIHEGGLAIHGGIIGGVIGLLLFCRKFKVSFFKLADIMAPALILGQAIGRWGNYFNMEAYGGQTDLPWAITVYDRVAGYIQVHPTFLYESIWDLAIFLILLFVIDKRKKQDGEVLSFYLILYSIGRFFIEGLRTDSLYFFGLRVAQFVSLVNVILGVGLLIYLRKSYKKSQQDDLRQRDNNPDEKK